MKTAGATRWAISFADLGLLLLGAFVFLHAIEASRPTAPEGAAVPMERTSEAGILAARGPAERFEPGEARLAGAGRARITALVATLGDGDLALASRGLAEGGRRLDRFELAAARTLAIARALREAGVAERRIEISFAQAAAPGDQRIELRRR